MAIKERILCVVSNPLVVVVFILSLYSASGSEKSMLESLICFSVAFISLTFIFSLLLYFPGCTNDTEVVRAEDCVFCKIVHKEYDCHKIWEDDNHIAFLSLNPNTEGFSVVATKNHYDSDAAQVSDKVYSDLMLAGRQASKKLVRAFGDVGRVALVLEGCGINHLHLKLIPLHGTAGEWKRIEAPKGEFFKEYQGYISTHGYEPASKEDLLRVHGQILNP